MKQGSPQVFEIAFPSRMPLRNVVRVSPHLPLPAAAVVPPPPPRPVVPDPAQTAREERRAIEQVLSQLREAIREMGTRYTVLVGEMRQAAVELAVAVAGRLVYGTLNTGEFPIEEMVDQALKRLPASETVRVFLHPDDLALLRSRLDDRPVLSSAQTEVGLLADANLSRGSCRAEAGEIHVRAELSSQIAGLLRDLQGETVHAQPESGPAAT